MHVVRSRPSPPARPPVRSRSRHPRRALAPFLLAATLASCTPAPAPEFRVGLIGVFDGAAAASSGLPARQGAQIAVDALNAGGGVRIGGVAHTVVLVDRETDMRPDAAATVARALINLDSVDVIVGPQQSAFALAAGTVAEASEVPLVAPMASSPSVTADRRLVTRLAFLDATQGRVLAQFAYDSLGARRAAALFNAASPYGREISTLFRETFEAHGGTMVGEATFDADDPASHSVAIRQLVATAPDVLLLPNFTVRDSSQFRLARSLGFRGRLLGSDAWDAVALSRRAEVQGAIIVANWDRRNDDTASRQFRDAFAARHPGETVRATAAATYDAIMLLARAATRAGARSGAVVMDSLRATGVYEGAFGRYRFVGTGDPERGASLLEVTSDSTRVRAVVAPTP
jgi:branched-chain amino acid transport system substrate-binding protein